MEIKRPYCVEVFPKLDTGLPNPKKNFGKYERAVSWCGLLMKEYSRTHLIQGFKVWKFMPLTNKYDILFEVRF